MRALVLIALLALGCSGVDSGTAPPLPDPDATPRPRPTTLGIVDRDAEIPPGAEVIEIELFPPWWKWPQVHALFGLGLGLLGWRLFTPRRREDES